MILHGPLNLKEKALDKGTFILLLHEYREVCKSNCYWLLSQNHRNNQPEVKDEHSLGSWKYCELAPKPTPASAL